MSKKRHGGVKSTMFLISLDWLLDRYKTNHFNIIPKRLDLVVLCVCIQATLLLLDNKQNP